MWNYLKWNKTKIELIFIYLLTNNCLFYDPFTNLYYTLINIGDEKKSKLTL